jgi:hypothetical protein
MSPTPSFPAGPSTPGSRGRPAQHREPGWAAIAAGAGAVSTPILSQSRNHATGSGRRRNTRWPPPHRGWTCWATGCSACCTSRGSSTRRSKWSSRRRSTRAFPRHPRFDKAAHRQGLRVDVWTIDDEADMHRLLSFGVDGIIMSDRPDVLPGVLGRQPSQVIGRPARNGILPGLGADV